MIIKYGKKFKKQYKKLPKSIQLKFKEKVQLFVDDPKHPQLRLHPLKGKYTGYWSINITGDFRALYYEQEHEVIIFALIGIHSQLY